MGVRSTAPWITRRAASMSAIVTLNAGSPGASEHHAARTAGIPAGPPASQVPLAPLREPDSFSISMLTDRRGPQPRAKRHVDRHQTPRLRPGHAPGTVRRRSGAPGGRFRRRFYHYRHPGGAGGHVHPVSYTHLTLPTILRV